MHDVSGVGDSPMTPAAPEHCGHECVCPNNYGYRNGRCERNIDDMLEPCEHDTRRSRPAPQPTNWSERLPPCPVCGGFTFCANIDGGYHILCLNDACKWKQEITAQQPSDALAELRKIFIEISKSGLCQHPDTDCTEECDICVLDATLARLRAQQDKQ